MKLVVDASVIAKWILPEPGSDLALGLRGYDVMVPDLAFAEIANLLAMRVVRGEMTAPEAANALDFVLAANPKAVSSRDLAAEALAMAGALKHPAYDLFYVALAREQGTRLVTADKKLVAKIRALDPPPPWAALVLPLEEFQPGAPAPALA
ncbi:type II toxin-antitoxin system VapC family toxin [Niveispirillum sp. KHB5.9]|uniref:type II toxin-antitoxin system VapC family toxin n=1 Tax=Niveispirillum sp. KHB5.9 TaxID=3400269 RepID=UPI003A854236